VLLDDPRVGVLQHAGLPFSLIGRTSDPHGLDYVDIDFDASTESALEHLQSLGHRRIALVQEGPLRRGFRSYGPKQRIRHAFRQLARRRGLDVAVMDCPATAGGGRKAVAGLLDQHPELTAIVVQNESAVPGVLTGLESAGRRVPADLSVLSLLTSADVGAMADPELTMLQAPGEQLGQLGVQRLIGLVEADRSKCATARPAPSADHRAQLIPCRLVRGRTTGPAPAA
jgi:DNA-binding LacI/PurR family transcriptional regulator